MHYDRLQAGDKVSQGGIEDSAEAGARKFIAKLKQSSKRLKPAWFQMCIGYSCYHVKQTHDLKAYLLDLLSTFCFFNRKLDDLQTFSNVLSRNSCARTIRYA